jgi:hypothetical protein
MMMVARSAVSSSRQVSAKSAVVGALILVLYAIIRPARRGVRLSRDRSIDRRLRPRADGDAGVRRG